MDRTATATRLRLYLVTVTHRGQRRYEVRAARDSFAAAIDAIHRHPINCGIAVRSLNHAQA